MAKRRRFTLRFKAQVALEALLEERTVQQIAALHGKIGPLVFERDFLRATLGR